MASGASQEAAAREIREALAPFGLALRAESTPDPDDRALLDDLLDRYLAGLRAELARHPDPRCDIPISALGLGARADSWLLSHEFYTVGQVMGGGVEELWSRYGVDPSWADLVEAGPARALLGEHEALVAAIARRLGSFGMVLGPGVPREAARPERLLEVRSDPSRFGAGILGLSRRVMAYLDAAGIRTVDDLVSRARARAGPGVHQAPGGPG